jgi:general secretion pathway protein N
MRGRLIAAGLCAYAAAIVVAAPATVLDAELDRVSGGRLRLAEASGSLWSGAGQLEALDPGDRSGVARRVTWRFRPASLLRGHIVYEVGVGDAAPAFPVTISLSGLEIAKAEIDLPAAVLGFAVPKLAALELTGEALIHVPQLSVGRGQMRGGATLRWRNAGSVLSPVSPLGDYELRLQADGREIHVVLRTLKGPIQIEGSGSWALGERPAFAGTSRVPAEDRDRLAPLLRLIAVERGAGTFELWLR